MSPVCIAVCLYVAEMACADASDIAGGWCEPSLICSSRHGNEQRTTTAEEEPQCKLTCSGCLGRMEAASYERPEKLFRTPPCVPCGMPCNVVSQDANVVSSKHVIDRIVFFVIS